MTEAAALTPSPSPAASPRHLLVCVDVQDDAGCAFAHVLVERAAALAKTLGARVTVLSVLPPLAAPIVADASAVAQQALIERAELQDASWRRVTATLAERLRERGVQASARVVERDGDAAAAIASSAVDVGADLVLLASHSRRGLSHAVLGSVSEKVMRVSPVPVMVVPRALLS